MRISLVRSINFAMLGRQDVASELGKKGTVTDISLFDRKESDVIRTWVVPNGFPEKIQPLFQAIGLAEHAVFLVDALDRFTGEQIVALDCLNVKSGILSHTVDVDEAQLDSMIRGTVLEQYTRTSPDQIREVTGKLDVISRNGPARVVIDHCFDVKGVGTVLLGKVASGTVKQYDTLTLYPAGTKVLVKSIQMHDSPVAESSCPARVGLAVKGVKPEDVGRGDILSEEGAVNVTAGVEIDFEKNPFYREGIAKNQMCLASIGLQIRSARISSVEPFGLSFEKPVACDSNDTAVILKPESTTIRIAGSGTIRLA